MFCEMDFFKTWPWLLLFLVGVIVFNANKVEAVYYGDEAIEGEFPYIVAISLENKGENGTSACTGSIISDEWVLTAAHCFSNGTQKSEGGNITTGIYRRLPWWWTRVPIAIEKVILHDSSHRPHNTPLADIALVKVAPKFKWSDEVQPVPLASTDWLLPGTAVQGQVAGWASNNNSVYVNTLQKANVTVFGYDMCLKTGTAPYEKSPYNKGVLECGRGHGASVCFGDSGTAIVVDGVQVGVVTASLNTGDMCGEPYEMTFVPVYRYFGWVQHHCGNCLSESVKRVPKPLVLTPDPSRWKSPSYRVSVYNVSGKAVCVGTLIGDRWVLTTATCVLGSQVALIGPWRAYEGFVKVNRTIVPNDFNPSKALHDVALLELASGGAGGWVEKVPKVRLDPSFLSPRSVATHICTQRLNKYFVEHPETSETLVHVIRDEDCQEYFTDFDSASMFCGLEALEQSAYYAIVEGFSVIRDGAIVGLKLKVYDGMFFHLPVRFTRITRRYVEWIDGHCDCLEYLRPQPRSIWGFNETTQHLWNLMLLLFFYYDRKNICEKVRGMYFSTIVKTGCLFGIKWCMPI